MSDITPSTNGHNRAADRTAINRANAGKSTGPRTAAGKQRSSLNALRHGLTGQTVVLPTEDLTAYQRHSQSFLDEYQPKGASETQLVQSLIDLSWRLNRAAAAETNLLTLGITEHAAQFRTEHPEAQDALAIAMAFREHNRALANISMYCQRYHRMFERSLAQLTELQEKRRLKERSELTDAAELLKMHKDDGLPYNPAQDGFVFTNEEIEAYIERHERLDQALDRTYAASAS